MAKIASVLALGTRTDAETFENGCTTLGFKPVESLREPSPTMAALRGWFGTKPDWIYFGGHFDEMKLFNEGDTVSIEFKPKRVNLQVGSAKAFFTKGGKFFKLDANPQMILWGGCSVCDTSGQMNTMRKLFGKHVLLGVSGSTSATVINAMLGGGAIPGGKVIPASDHFFGRVTGNINPKGIRDAWMETAKFYVANSSGEYRGFRAVDPDGQVWKIDSSGNVVKGSKVT